MSRRNKLAKFAALDTFSNVIQYFGEPDFRLVAANRQTVDLKGRWREYFGIEGELTLELACGRGEYSLALGRAFPERLFIGVDIKGARIYQGAVKGLEEQLANVAFLRTRIEFISYFFAPGELDEIWITFPDPFPNKENRRLTAPIFLDRYRTLLKPGGIVHLKTDDPDLHAYSVAMAQSIPGIDLEVAQEDIYARPLIMPELAYQTYYERMHLADGRKINYMRMRYEKASKAG